MGFNFKRKVLKNGIVVLFEKRETPVVSVAFAVRHGGINESLKEKGISHFIEHMLYKGTKRRDSEEISKEIEKNGGELNGFTTEDMTAYWCKMPSRHVRIALDVLGDMIKNSVFDTKEIDKERKVIFEEVKMRKDTPMIYVHDKVQSLLYGGTLSLDAIGTYDTIGSISKEDLVKRFKEVYVPENIVLCVVGDADFEKIIEFADKTFSKLKGKIPEFEIKKKTEEKIEKRKNIGQANMVFAYHSPLFGDRKSYASLVLNTMMAAGLSSRLFFEIRQKRNLAYAIKGDSTVSKKFAYNTIYVGTQKENVGVVRKLILEEFDKVSKNLGKKELNQVKEQLIGNHLIGMEDSQHQMANLLEWEINGNAKEYYNFEKNIRNVKIEDVKKIAKEAVNKHSFFVLIPE